MATQFLQVQFNIVPTSYKQPSPGVGANPPPSRIGAGSPIIFSGQSQVWSFEPAPDSGKPCLYLEGRGFAVDYEQQVFVNGTVARGDDWIFEKNAESNFYRILLTGTDLAWTLSGPEEDPQVVLQNVSASSGFQEWLIRPVNSDA